MLCATAILSAMLLTHCRSERVADVRPAEVPPLVFPEFPRLEGAVRNDDGSVTVPGEWLVRLAEYRIRVEEARADWEAWAK